MPEGERLLSRTPARIDLNVLREYPGYAEWGRQSQPPSADWEAARRSSDDLKETPEEALDRAAEQLRGALEADVLHRVRDAAPAFLERVAAKSQVLDLPQGCWTAPGQANHGCTIRELACRPLAGGSSGRVFRLAPIGTGATPLSHFGARSRATAGETSSSVPRACAAKPGPGGGRCGESRDRWSRPVRSPRWGRRGNHRRWSRS